MPSQLAFTWNGQERSGWFYFFLRTRDGDCRKENVREDVLHYLIIID